MIEGRTPDVYKATSIPKLHVRPKPNGQLIQIEGDSDGWNKDYMEMSKKM